MAVSRAKLLLQTQRWDFHESGTQAVVKNCPLCSNNNHKFYINVSGETNDGLWDCKVCGQSGNFNQLKQRLGMGMENVVSAKDMAGHGEPQPLPDFDALHNNLMNNPEYGDVLDYLVAERKFSLEVIEKFKIGAWTKDGSQWYVIPYFDSSGNGVYYKSRRFGVVPDKGSRFNSPHGREVGLFNEACVVPNMEVLYIVEGEPDALSMLSSGYDNVVAVPGAGVKKAAWIEKLDKLAPKNIYIIFDNDKPGQAGAHELALRIGLDKVKNVCLPDFGGKDVNDWFKMGHSKEALDILIEDSRFFDVQGVQALPQLLEELRVEIETKGTDPTYDTPWPSLTKRMGGVEAGDLVGLLAGAKIGKTTMALNWLQYYADKGIDSMMFCQEMQPRRMVRKWVSMVTNTPDTPGASKITVDTIDSAMEYARNMPGDLLFGYTKSCRVDDVVDTIRQTVRRYGIKIVCFDNLQMLVRSLEHAPNEISSITKKFKALCMEMNIAMILIIQPHRVPDGQIPSARNAMGSSSPEKDVDTMVCAHRNRVAVITKESDFKGVVETNENFEPQMLVRVDLSRYAPGGQTVLYIDGATSKIREMCDYDEVTAEAPTYGIIQTEVKI